MGLGFERRRRGRREIVNKQKSQILVRRCSRQIRKVEVEEGHCGGVGTALEGGFDEALQKVEVRVFWGAALTPKDFVHVTRRRELPCGFRFHPIKLGISTG